MQAMSRQHPTGALCRAWRALDRLPRRGYDRPNVGLTSQVLPHAMRSHKTTMHCTGRTSMTTLITGGMGFIGLHWWQSLPEYCRESQAAARDATPA